MKEQCTSSAQAQIDDAKKLKKQRNKERNIDYRRRQKQEGK